MATEERNILDVGSRAVEVVHQLPNWSYLISSSKTMSESFSRHHQRHIPRDITSSLNHSQHTHISLPCVSQTHTHTEMGHLVIAEWQRVSNRISCHLCLDPLHSSTPTTLPCGSTPPHAPDTKCYVTACSESHVRVVGGVYLCGNRPFPFSALAFVICLFNRDVVV